MQVQTNDLKFILVFGLVIATGLVMLLCLPKISWGQNIVSNITIDDIQFPFVVSTRNHFNPSTGKLEDHNATDYDAPNIPWLNKTSACPPEIAIFVHGWGLDKSESNERFDRVKMSLVQNGYNMPVIGFTWDAKALWPFAQHISKENGPKLGQFISDLKNNCEQLKIRLIGHSLGARVVLSSLDYLQNNELWNSKNFEIESVHLLGAAVDNEEISTNKQVIDLDATNWGTVKSPEKTGYGQAVQEEVLKFYNLYNPEDSIFEPNAIYPLYPFQIYPSFEGDWALGQNGYQTFPNDIVLTLPTNYKQIDVQNEIPQICNADGYDGPDAPLVINLPVKRGDNHGGYIGFRDVVNHTKLIDDGVMNVVVDNWNDIVPSINQSPQQTAICK